jgi:hypothetical protein
VDSTPLSIADSLKSKLWKTRQSGLDSLLASIKASSDPVDPIFTEHFSELTKLLSDSNLVILEKTITCLVSISKIADPRVFEGFEWKEMLTNSIEKGYSMNKPGIKANIEEILLFSAQKIDRNGVVEVSVGLLGHKNPKVGKKNKIVFISLIFLLYFQR